MRITTINGEWEEWMMAAQAGDSRAYDRLLRAMLPLLRGIARRRIVDAAEAEDAVQDTLLTLHRLRHAWDPSRPLRPWLATLCERRCIDRLRAGMRRQRRQVPIELLPELITAQPLHPAQNIAEGELRAAVAKLPRTQRIALELAKLQELSLAEAAAHSGLTPGGLKVATHRALRRLRQEFAPLAG